MADTASTSGGIHLSVDADLAAGAVGQLKFSVAAEVLQQVETGGGFMDMLASRSTLDFKFGNDVKHITTADFMVTDQYGTHVDYTNAF